MHIIEQLFESPITAIVVAVVLGALALSGRFSVTATQIMLLGAWAVAIFGLRMQPLPILCGVSAVLGGCLVLLAYYFRPETVPSYSGILVPRSSESLLFSPKGGGSIPKLQIGTSGVFLIGEDGEIGKLLFPALAESQFKVEAIDGTMKVSAQITDENGHLMVELVRNEWKVAPPPKTWDRNYTDDALEVRDAEGRVVLQVHALFDRIQIQGMWWIQMPPPNGWTRLIIWKDPVLDGAQIVFNPKNGKSPPPSIPPIFEYPSDKHFGELKK
jgi:hypothetical protein